MIWHGQVWPYKGCYLNIENKIRIHQYLISRILSIFLKLRTTICFECENHTYIWFSVANNVFRLKKRLYAELWRWFVWFDLCIEPIAHVYVSHYLKILYHRFWKCMLPYINGLALLLADTTWDTSDKLLFPLTNTTEVMHNYDRTTLNHIFTYDNVIDRIRT